MKLFTIIIFVFISFAVSAQKYALIDRDFKKPILFTDSITINQVSKNYFPVRVNDLDTLVANINYLKEQLKTSIQRSKFKTYKLKSGSTIVQINSIAHAYGDAYDITLVTTANNVNAEYLIADNKLLNKKATRKLDAFTNFIKKDKELFIKEFKNYEPVVFDATVYIPSKY